MPGHWQGPPQAMVETLEAAVGAVAEAERMRAEAAAEDQEEDVGTYIGGCQNDTDVEKQDGGEGDRRGLGTSRGASLTQPEKPSKKNQESTSGANASIPATLARRATSASR